MIKFVGMNTHYYILPDGRRANSMREVKEMLGIPPKLFREMRKHNLIKKIDLMHNKEMSNSKNDTNEQFKKRISQNAESSVS